MNEKEPESEGMSPAAIDVLEALLRTHAALSPPDAEEPGTEQLVRYTCQALSREQKSQVERGLTSDHARKREREVRAAVVRLQALPWSQVEQEAMAGDAVAQIWLTLAAEQSDVMPRVAAWRNSRTLAHILDFAAKGVQEAQAAWAAITAFGEQLRMGLTIAGAMPATAKGSAGDRPLVVGNLPEDVEITLLARIEPDGALRASMTLKEPSGQHSATASGQTAHLMLRFRGEEWPVASTIITDGLAEWSVPTLGTALRLPPGRLPSDCLQVVLGEAAAPAHPAARTLLAEVLDAEGRPLSKRAVEITLPDEPRRQDGQLLVRVAVPPVSRIAYASYRLALEVAIFAQHWQRLGLWPLAEWSDEPRLLAVPCPGSLEAGPVFESPLRIRLIPPPGG